MFDNSSWPSSAPSLISERSSHTRFFPRPASIVSAWAASFPAWLMKASKRCRGISPLFILVNRFLEMEGRQRYSCRRHRPAQPRELGKANSTRTANDIRALLQETARLDADTGAAPGNAWGAGKLDVEAACA